MARLLLADADAFFVAVARMEDPEGAGKAELLIVGGSAEGRGVVCSASYEARRFGVRSAMPMSRAIRLCPDAMVVPVPRACSRKHREIRDVLEKWAPVVSAASIDEWYCDMSGTEALYNEPLEKTAHRMRDAVKSATGMSISFGGGSNRLIAKLAVEVAKPKPGSGANGVHIVPDGEEAAFMRRFRLADIPGIGPKSQERLAKLGLRSVDDVLAHDIPTLSRWVGEREAEWLHERARGRAGDEVSDRDDAKQVSREETFGTDIADDRELERELLALVTRAAADLRDDGRRARTISVKLRDADFTTRSASRTLGESVESDRAIFSVARELLAKLRQKRRTPARLVGVALSGLETEGTRQLRLFEAASASDETERDRQVSRALDRVRHKLGISAIHLGEASGRRRT
jgi:DNA polymerase IV